MIGVRQAGIPVFRIGNIVRHGAHHEPGEKLAEEALARADAEELAKLEAAATRKWGERTVLGEVL